MNEQPKELLKKTGLYDIIGEENFFEHTGQAIQLALKQLERTKCLGCRHFAFTECKEFSPAQRIGTQQR